MHKAALLSFSLATLVPVASRAEGDLFLRTFRKIQISDQFWGEGASFGDFNQDGVNDIVSGPFWYEGPDFKTRHEYAAAQQTFKLKLGAMTEISVPGYEGALGKNNTYSENFFAFTRDFNGDGWSDIAILGFPGKDSWWFENPKNGSGHWKRHTLFDVTENESPTLTDLIGAGSLQLVCNSGGFFGYAVPVASDPTAKWAWHKITPAGKWQRFTHGLGVGDVNGDGRMDLLDMDGWWEQPASLAGDPEWQRHAVPFAPGSGSSQMYVYDVNGDGRNDVISALAAHGYGLAWYEQLVEKGTDGSPQFRQHVIMNKEPNENKYGVRFSQLHAVDLVDMDGDGLKDIVTGKRFWAHGPTGDAEPNAAAVLYWFKLVRGADHSVDFVPYLIDNNSGVGTQVVAADVNKDGLPDVVVGNKRGTFVHLQEKKSVSREEWEKNQPKSLR
jgi:FG-GAP-like repeat/FG-GAP repeat